MFSPGARVVDEALRRLERRCTDGGSGEDEAAWILARVRAGEALDWATYSRLVRVDSEAAAECVDRLLSAGALSLERAQIAAAAGEPGTSRFFSTPQPSAPRPRISDDEWFEVQRQTYGDFNCFGGDDNAGSLRKVWLSLRARESPEQDLFELLSERDWRPVLVGAVGLLGLAPSARCLAALWSRVGTSYVSNQCAVVLSLKDPEFLTKTQARLEDPTPPRSWPREGQNALRVLCGGGSPEDLESITDPALVEWMTEVEGMRRFLD